VAACLEIPRARVAPMNAEKRSAAGQADVAVFLGADKIP
jgi:hypothetical protein